MLIPSRLTSSLRYGLMGGAMLALLSAPAVQAQTVPPGLSVQAQSWVDVAPDKATLNARLWENTPAVPSVDETDQDALNEARERLETRASELLAALEDIGIDRRMLSAGSLNVYPDYVSGTRNDDGEQEMLQRTRLERPFSVEINDLDQLGDVLNALMNAGVNALDGVAFDLHDREAATDEALTKALEKAQRKAGLMADTLDIELGPIQRVEETQSPVFAPRMMAMRAESQDASGGSVQSDYSPGTIRIDAGVRVEWSLTAPDAQDRPDTDVAAQEE